MKTLFDIGTEREEGKEETLLLEVGRGHCSVAYFHKASNTISRVQVVSFEEPEMEERFPHLLRSFAHNRFASVVACSAFPQALLFPAKFFKKDYSVLNTVYDLPAQAYFYDRIDEWQMVNAYAVPERIYDALTASFPEVQFLHCYTPAIKAYSGFVADHQLSVHFTENYFRVLLKKDMAVHLVQSYAYGAPQDVVYYLLKICFEFGLSQQDVFLIVSGLVAKDSQLFHHLQQYFTHLHVARQPENGFPESPHPHHFFTSLYNLAACVS